MNGFKKKLSDPYRCRYGRYFRSAVHACAGNGCQKTVSERLRPFRQRKGVETIEVALTLPLLMIATFSTIQINHHWHKEKLLKIATFEAVKAGAAKNGTSADVRSVFNEHCKALGIKNARINFYARNFDSQTPGRLVWASARAPVKDNRLSAPFNMNISSWISGGYVVYRKEGL